jgi:hypothetical protein
MDLDDTEIREQGFAKKSYKYNFDVVTQKQTAFEGFSENHYKEIIERSNEREQDWYERKLERYKQGLAKVDRAINDSEPLKPNIPAIICEYNNEKRIGLWFEYASLEECIYGAWLRYHHEVKKHQERLIVRVTCPEKPNFDEIRKRRDLSYDKLFKRK